MISNNKENGISTFKKLSWTTNWHTSRANDRFPTQWMQQLEEEERLPDFLLHIMNSNIWNRVQKTIYTYFYIVHPSCFLHKQIASCTHNYKSLFMMWGLTLFKSSKVQAGIRNSNRTYNKRSFTLKLLLKQLLLSD